jgi:hypothetical protein
MDQAVVFELAQLLGEHFLRARGQRPLELGKSDGASEKVE